MHPSPRCCWCSLRVALSSLLWFCLATLHVSAATLADNFADPTPISGRLVHTASNTLATAQASEPAHAGIPASRSLWATWTATNRGTFSFSTSNSLDASRLWLDTTIAVYTGNSLTNLTLVASNDDMDDAFTLWSRVFFRAYPGETFHIAVDMADANSGIINLAIDFAGPFMSPWVAPDLNGQEISSFSFIGKILMVDFWETTCGACVDELPYLMDLHRSFKPRGFELVGLSADPNPQIVRDYLATRPVPYTMGMKSITSDFSLSGSIGMPTKVLVDQDSRIVARYLGGVSPASATCAYYERQLAGLLRTPPPGPRLQVLRSGADVQLSWPASEPPQRLEGTSNPATNAASWSLVNGSATTNSGRRIITVPATNAARFFRLKQL
jgi:thiol-disulfide isomerase/thioredoxin